MSISERAREIKRRRKVRKERIKAKIKAAKSAKIKKK